jgi:hypothetical protein
MNRVCSHLGVVVLASTAVLARPSAFQVSPEKDRTYSVGILRADGALVPFAQYDRGNWKVIWTGVSRRGGVTVPLTLEDVDKEWWGRGGPSLKWMLWEGPSKQTAFTVTTPRVVSAACSAQPALATDYKPAGVPPPPDQTPYPKVGIATTAPITFEPIEQISSEHPGWARVKAALDLRVFREAENADIAEMGWRHPMAPSTRDRWPIDLQAVWHVKDSRFYYFEAMRRYPDRNPPRGQPPCDLVTYVAGYFWDKSERELRPIGVSALISYCHMERAAFLWPFGVIREGSKQFWLFQSAGWTSEAYGITEPIASRGEVRQHLWHVAGRCR